MVHRSVEDMRSSTPNAAFAAGTAFGARIATPEASVTLALLASVVKSKGATTRLHRTGGEVEHWRREGGGGMCRFGTRKSILIAAASEGERRSERWFDESFFLR